VNLVFTPSVALVTQARILYEILLISHEPNGVGVLTNPAKTIAMEIHCSKRKTAALQSNTAVY
jgi:hypothetical protein